MNLAVRVTCSLTLLAVMGCAGNRGGTSMRVNTPPMIGSNGVMPGSYVSGSGRNAVSGNSPGIPTGAMPTNPAIQPAGATMPAAGAFPVHQANSSTQPGAPAGEYVIPPAAASGF